MSPKEASEGFNLQPQPRYSNPQILPIQHEVSYGRVNLNPWSTKMTWPGQGVCKVDSSYRVFIWECKRDFKYNPLKPKTRHFGWAYYRSISQFLIHNRLLRPHWKINFLLLSWTEREYINVIISDQIGQRPRSTYPGACVIVINFFVEKVVFTTLSRIHFILKTRTEHTPPPLKIEKQNLFSKIEVSSESK